MIPRHKVWFVHGNCIASSVHIVSVVDNDSDPRCYQPSKRSFIGRNFVSTIPTEQSPTVTFNGNDPSFFQHNHSISMLLNVQRSNEISLLDFDVDGMTGGD